MNYADILIEPVVSEKATALREQNKYVFIVQPAATKIQIKEAVSKGSLPYKIIPDAWIPLLLTRPSVFIIISKSPG